MKITNKILIKDISYIILFCIFFYFVTHNPFNYPKPIVKKGVYVIQLMQRPLVLGIAGHNYLVLRDDKNSILYELHGLATDQKTGNWKYIGNDKSDLLKVWEFSGERVYTERKSYSGVTLYEGDKNSTFSIWQKAIPCGEKINNKNISYPPYGLSIKNDTENSNSVAYTLIVCMNLNPKHLGLITPGWGNNLLNN